MEKIVAMMPFPSIFKARLLSKLWLAKFEPIGSLRDEEEVRIATSFQKEVRERSKHWDTFCPVCINEEELFAYHQKSQNWQRVSLLSFLPKDPFLIGRDLRGSSFYRAKKNVHLEGALLYGTWETDSFDSQILFVANILTRKWKQLPPRPNADSWKGILCCMKLVSDPSSEAYKVILSCQDGHQDDPYFTLIYDSKSETWSSKKFVSASNFCTSPSSFAYLDGVLYGVSVANLTSLVAFSVEEGTMDGLRVALDKEVDIDTARLVVCNANLMMILSEVDETVRVLKMDVESLRWREIASCHPSAFKLGERNPSVGEGHCIFFEMGFFEGVMLVFNPQDDEWHFFDFSKTDYQWCDCSFQPGLNPFMAV